ncbi:hypothetical protein KY360_03805 [Candidatus Woesearchaeota archaeon]|nr:hypothetical protein [Candidatus Woesearchaeota archaeon]
MEEEFWLKYGFKENGELICTRTIANSKPVEQFFYTEDEKHKEVKNAGVVKLTKEAIEKLRLMEGV